MEISDGNLNFTIQPSVSGRNYQLQGSDSMESGTWTDVGVVRSGEYGTNVLISIPHVVGVQKRFYRAALVEATPAPTGFSLISAGSFQMGDQSNPLVGYSWELPVHSVYVSAYYMAKYEVTKELWDTVRAWGLNNGYTDLAVGNGTFASKGANHPVHSISWYDMVKWCNARSQKEDLTPCYTVGGLTYKTGSSAPDCNWNANGYRLPSEAEWEKASRGGMSGKNFPWGADTISHSQANYHGQPYSSYDLSGVGNNYHPIYNDGVSPYTSPVGSFAANGYGLYDIAGNVWEWCWDRYDSYTADSQTNPQGAPSGSSRVYRGGAWYEGAREARCAHRSGDGPGGGDFSLGFRLARGQP